MESEGGPEPVQKLWKLTAAWTMYRGTEAMAALQRATQGFATVAVATTVATLGLGVYEAQRSTVVGESASGGTQTMSRPFDTPSGTDLLPGAVSATAIDQTELPTGLVLPTVVYQAYLHADAQLAGTQPACRLTWPVLAGIGHVESGHARGAAIAADGTTTPPIIGPALDGNGFAAIRDTDDGRWDGDTEWDRAVGPMQFIPASWAEWGTDGNADGAVSPHNVYDAALAAGRYLCHNDGNDLSDPRELREAILSYNQSAAYADTVLAWIARFSGKLAPEGLPDAIPSPSPTPSKPRPKPAPSPSPTNPPQQPSPSEPSGASPLRRSAGPARPQLPHPPPTYPDRS